MPVTWSYFGTLGRLSTPLFWKLAANEFLLLYFFLQHAQKRRKECQKWPKMVKNDQKSHNTFKVTLFCITDHFSQQFLKRHIKKHIANFSNSLGHRKYFFKQNLSIEFQFQEPLRDALHWGNFDFVMLTPLRNTVMITQGTHKFTFDCFKQQ